MDTITIKDIKFSTLIGVHPWEKETPQTLHLDLTYPTDADTIAHTDSLEQAIDYDKVLECVLMLIKDNHFNLIETLAVRITEVLLARFPITWVTVTLHKPGALLNAKDVAITITRGIA